MDIQRIIESLSPNEQALVPHLGNDVDWIVESSGLDRTSVLRALGYLENKGIVKIFRERKKLVDLGVNGILYKKKGLPERRLLHWLAENRILKMGEAKKKVGLSDDELKASIGALKKKALITIKNGKIMLEGKGEEVSKKSMEEIFLESLPVDFESLTPEQKYSLNNLEKRKGIVEIRESENLSLEVTDLGKKVVKSKDKIKGMIEVITPEILGKESAWKGKIFRRYDVTSKLPEINGGKRHFVNQAIDYARRVWSEMGFQEMTGSVMQSSFWNFDALFTAQDHPVREMQDTFFIKKKMKLPDKKIVDAVKRSHEKGVDGSKGWGYDWDEEKAKKGVLRTHTTCLSSHALSGLNKKNTPAKFFAIGKCFRNETVDWSHGFEFNQTEGIVVGENLTFRNLLGYLQEFFKKMGFEKIRFRPAYFPYTEPSVEIDVWHPERKVWLELGGAGMFRPEVVIPLLGEKMSVLAWGPGFDRMIMDYYEIKDLRELYKNDLTKLRKKKFWVK